MCHPFVTHVEDLADDISSITGTKGQFIEIQNDETLRYNFHKQISLGALWIEMNNRKNMRNEIWKFYYRFLQYTCMKQDFNH